MWLLLLACVHAPPKPDLALLPAGPPPTTLIRDVRVFTATDAGVLEHHDVRLEGGRIAAIAPTGTLSGDVVVDGGGDATLVPGLVDLHVHLALDAGPPWFLTLPDAGRAAEATVYAGITTVLDVGGDPATLARVSRRIAAGRQRGPRIVYAGQGLTVAGGYPLSMLRAVYGPLAYLAANGRHFRAVDDVAAIEREVDRLADAGARVIKLMAASIPPADPPTPRLSEAQVAAAVARAHSRGLRVAAHVDTAEDALLCARTGVDLLAHGVETSTLTPEDAATLAASGIAMTPTLVNWRRFDDLTALSFAPTAAERASMPPRVIAAFSAEALDGHREVLEGSSFRTWADALQTHRADRAANVATARSAGVPIRVGSDSGGSIGTFPGALHQELALLVEAGMPVDEVLVAATRGNALWLDPQADYGAIAPGLTADLILLPGDPRADLAVFDRLREVWVAGVPTRGVTPRR